MLVKVVEVSYRLVLKALLAVNRGMGEMVKTIIINKIREIRTIKEIRTIRSMYIAGKSIVLSKIVMFLNL